MKISDQCGYIGRMKQPLQHPDIDNPTMFILFDYHKTELDLILLSPGAFLHAYKAIKYLNPRSVKIFTPSDKVDFISDIFNLCHEVNKLMPIQWVFPKKNKNISLFQILQEKKSHYQNPYDDQISISYKENPNICGLYDIIARTRDVVNYFTFFISEEQLSELWFDKSCDLIHLAASSPIYGGLSYKEAVKINGKYRKCLVPNGFTSVDEFYEFMKCNIPEGKYKEMWNDICYIRKEADSKL